jgi:hypothetical protein
MPARMTMPPRTPTEVLHELRQRYAMDEVADIPGQL